VGPFEPLEPLGVQNQIDLEDPAGTHRHRHDAYRPPVRHPDQPRGVVDHRRPGGRREPAEAECLPGHRRGSPDHGHAAVAGVGPQHDVGVEYGHQGLEVAAARRGEEGLDDPPQLAALILSIAAVNLWNRLNVATGQVPGSGQY
jgi:hypothetical protein